MKKNDAGKRRKTGKPAPRTASGTRRAAAAKTKPRPMTGSAKANPQGRRLQPADVIPGEILLGEGDIEALQGRETCDLRVANTADRPIQVGSHCHFFEVNRALKFDRERAFGFRLCIPAGTAVRFEPGEEKRVTLVQIGGNRLCFGINGLTNGSTDDPAVKEAALSRADERGFRSLK